jgi:hypothetical protein
MRWMPIVGDVALTVAMWTAVLTIERRWRTKATAGASARDVRSYNLQRAATICVMVGVTCFIAWLVTDSVGPRWLHSILPAAALILIAVGAVWSGYAAWVKAR